jgi:hypothetical protein
MRQRILSLLLVGSALLGAAACATSQEWAEWRGHSTHYASGQHLVFSWRNREGTAPRVSRRDIQASRAETWWGRVITVTPEQIFQE